MVRKLKNIYEIKTPSNRVRFAILARDDFRCRYCGKSGKDGFELQVDHLIPISLFDNGYTYKIFHTLNSDIGLVTCCHECNVGKRSNLLDPKIVKAFMKENEKNQSKYEKFGNIDVKREYEKILSNRDLIKKLIAWLKIPGNSEAKIANALGYKSSVSIYQWLKRGRIPFHQIDAVVKFLKGKKR